MRNAAVNNENDCVFPRARVNAKSWRLKWRLAWFWLLRDKMMAMFFGMPIGAVAVIFQVVLFQASRFLCNPVFLAGMESLGSMRRCGGCGSWYSRFLAEMADLLFASGGLIFAVWIRRRYSRCGAALKGLVGNIDK